MNHEFDPNRYRNVKGSPAFPPPSTKRENDYISDMIRRDQEFERRNPTLPVNYCG